MKGGVGGGKRRSSVGPECMHIMTMRICTCAWALYVNINTYNSTHMTAGVVATGQVTTGSSLQRLQVNHLAAPTQLVCTHQQCALCAVTHEPDLSQQTRTHTCVHLWRSLCVCVCVYARAPPRSSHTHHPSDAPCAHGDHHSECDGGSDWSGEGEEGEDELKEVLLASKLDHIAAGACVCVLVGRAASPAASVSNIEVVFKQSEEGIAGSWGSLRGVEWWREDLGLLCESVEGGKVNGAT